MYTVEQLKYIFTKTNKKLNILPNKSKKTFLVLGSASNPTIAEDKLKNADLVCVNASGYCASKLKLQQTPKITIMSGYMAQETTDPVKITTRESIRNLKTTELV